MLIGMPGSGKTELGRQAAGILSLPFLDADAMIEGQEGMTIAGIFDRVGEEGFRKLETETLRGLLDGAAPEGAGAFVLATGGGVVTRAENRSILTALGRVVYIRRGIEAIASSVAYGGTRPLLGNQDMLFKLWAARRPLYEDWAEDTFAVVEGEAIGEAATRLAELIAERGQQ